jgi:DNA-damage-inducible protein J
LLEVESKRELKKIFDKLGMDMSSAIKLFFRQTINAQNLPFELRGENGLTLRGAELLRESIISAKNNPKSFKTGSSLINDALKD